jgi:hypothetical protein
MQKSRREDKRKGKKRIRSYELNQKSIGHTHYLEMEG